MPPQKQNNAPARKHCKRYNTPNDFHYLTFSCFHRQSFLSRDRPRQWLAESITSARTKLAFHLIAYVFMPEHVHLLIRPMEKEYSISNILHAIKLPVSRKARAFVLKEAPAFQQHMTLANDKPSTIRFWQTGGGHDRNIFSPKELWEKISYIHRNPVKRKLVTQATEWIWSSAADYAKIRSGPLPVDNQDLPWLS